MDQTDKDTDKVTHVIQSKGFSIKSKHVAKLVNDYSYSKKYC